MDMITLAMAKAYTNSQRLAYSDPAVVLSWDGDKENNEIIKPDGLNLTYVKLSSDFYDLTRATHITINNIKEELTSENSLAQTEGGFSQLASVDETTIWAFSSTDGDADISKGTYMATVYNAIEFAETIHPIDPKYLPGVCLPVVEFSEETMASLFANSEAICTAEEHAVFYAALNTASPVVIKGNYNGIRFSGVSNILLDSEYAPYFEANAGVMKMKVLTAEMVTAISMVQ